MAIYRFARRAAYASTFAALLLLHPAPFRVHYVSRGTRPSLRRHTFGAPWFLISLIDSGSLRMISRLVAGIALLAAVGLAGPAPNRPPPPPLPLTPPLAPVP